MHIKSLLTLFTSVMHVTGFTVNDSFMPLSFFFFFLTLLLKLITRCPYFFLLTHSFILTLMSILSCAIRWLLLLFEILFSLIWKNKPVLPVTINTSERPAVFLLAVLHHCATAWASLRGCPKHPNTPRLQVALCRLAEAERL